MTRLWPVLTAASLLTLAGTASAGEWSFDWGGQGNFSGYYIDQTEVPSNSLNGYGFAAEGKTWGRVKTVTDSGLEIGLRGQLRFQSSEHEFSNDTINGAPDVVDEVWLYIQSAFGRATIGLEDGAADSAGIFSPTVSEINRLDDARAFPLQDPISSSFTAYEPNGAHIRTDLNASGDALKIIYYSPRLIGIQLSASYTPELTRGFNDLFNSNDQADQQSDIWEVGVNYQGSLSAFDVGFYAGYVAGYNEKATVGHTVSFVAPQLIGGAQQSFNAVAFTPGDLEEYGAGAQIAYEGLKVGGSYRVTNIAGGAGLADGGGASIGCGRLAGCVLPDNHTTIWGAGVTYETGPWRVGAEYVNLEEELPRILDGAVLRDLTQDAQGWAGSVGYEFDENARIVAGYQSYTFDGPAGTCVAGPTPVCDTLDANLGYIQTSITF